ncbi:proline-rich protein 18 [Mixophyes fleayi]|uniref:proline-rich protein 18 n=1 Tax=Mixophyes fleayi TaxID=3061075 RepID=UPI003F4DDA75
MSFPPILQHPPVLPSRIQLNKVSERGDSHYPPILTDINRTPMDKEDLSNSWPSAMLRRQLERRPRADAGSLSHQVDIVHPARRFLEQIPRGITRSYESIIHPRPATITKPRRELTKDPQPSRRHRQQQQQTAQHDHPVQESMAAPHQGSQTLQPQQVNTDQQQHSDVHFSLCLTPEAILVIQKRNLEKQLAHQQRSANSRRIFASSSRPVKCPRNRADLTHNNPLQRSTPDVRELVKISLLNDQHRYDDMEYEDDGWLREGDEGLVRKCTEWLRGVEVAAERERNLHDKLQSLPHLNTF